MSNKRTPVRLTESTKDDGPVVLTSLPEALSLGDQRYAVMTAFRAKFGDNPVSDVGGVESYCDVEVFPDFVICDKAGKKYRMSYTISDGGDVEFVGEMEQVVLEFAPVTESDQDADAAEPLTVKFRESEGGPLLLGTIREAVTDKDGDTGWRWRVTVIESGHTKERRLANGVRFVRDYPIKVLEAAIPLFEGVAVFAFSGSDHTRPGAKGPRDEVGYLENVAREGTRIDADLVIHRDADWLRQRMLGLKENNRLDRGGLSIDAEGEGEWLKEGGLDVFRISALTGADSVDVVTSPAAGGQFRRMVASEQADDDITTEAQGAKAMNLKQILALIESKRPELLEGVDRDKITIEAATKLLESAMAPPAPDDEKDDDEKDETPAPPKAPVTESTNPGVTPEDITRLTETVAGLQESQAKSLCANILDAKLSESQLPKAAKEAVRKRFVGKVFDVEDLTEAIDSTASMLGAVASDMPRSYVGVAVTSDEREKKVHALEALFWGGPNDRTHENFPEYLKDVTPYRSFVGAYRDFTGLHDAGPQEVFSESAKAFPAAPVEGESRRWRESLTESLTTGSWPQILGDSMRRRMIAEYSMQGRQDWRKITSDIANVPDFRTNRRMRMGGYGTLTTVAEQDTYPTLTSPTDEEETYAVAKRGGLEDVTFEMIKNDDVGQIRRIPGKLGRAAANTLYRNVFDHLEDNTALADTYGLINSANHSNDINAALSNASLTTGRRMLLDQMAYNDSAEVLGIANAPLYVIVPHELDETSWQLLQGWGRGQGEHDASNLNNANFHGYQGMERIVVDYFAVATDWWMAADPAAQPTIEVGFLDGREEPEMFVQDAPNVGSVFTADKISYKIRHIYQSVPLDYRWIAGHQA